MCPTILTCSCRIRLIMRGRAVGNRKRDLIQRTCPITGNNYPDGEFFQVAHSYLEAAPRQEDGLLVSMFTAELFVWFRWLLEEFTAHTAAAVQSGPVLSTLQRFERKWLKL